MVENQAGIGTLPARQINAFSHYESASPAHEDPEPADLGALEEFGRPRCTVYAQITGSNPVRSANTRGCIHAHGIRIGNGAQVAQAEHACVRSVPAQPDGRAQPVRRVSPKAKLGSNPIAPTNNHNT